MNEFHLGRWRLGAGVCGALMHPPVFRARAPAGGAARGAASCRDRASGPLPIVWGRGPVPAVSSSSSEAEGLDILDTSPANQ